MASRTSQWWASAALAGGLFGFYSNATAQGVNPVPDAPPASDVRPTPTESAATPAEPPVVDLFEGLRSGQVGLRAEGARGGAMTLSITNTSPRPLRVVLPPGAFLQATAAGEAALARLTGTHCEGAGLVADLFCGVGPFALRLAERARIIAADNDAAAVAALKRAAAGTQGLKPIEAIERDLFRRPFARSELGRFDAVVFDPPRQGAAAQARELAASAVATVVAVSCNPTTFARDARILVDGGYRLVRVTPVDQFLYSAHVELVARFQKTEDRRGSTEKG